MMFDTDWTVFKSFSFALRHLILFFLYGTIRLTLVTFNGLHGLYFVRLHANDAHFLYQLVNLQS